MKFSKISNAIKSFIVISVIFFFTLSVSFAADIVELPVANQLQFLQRMLSVEKQLSKSKENEIMIGIIYQSDFKTSKKTADNIKMYAEGKPIKAGNKTLKFIPIDIKKSKNVVGLLNEESYKLDVIMITQLSNINYSDIKKYAVDNSVLTFATHQKTMETNKFSLAVGYKSNGFQLFFNPQQISEEGFIFPANVFIYAKKIE